jgi:integrase/recombinase XerD
VNASSTLADLIDILVAARRAGGFRYNHQERVLCQFAEHSRRQGYADGSIIQEAVEGFLYGRHLKASTIRREEIILRELAEHARQFGWQACVRVEILCCLRTSERRSLRRKQVRPRSCGR